MLREELSKACVIPAVPVDIEASNLKPSSEPPFVIDDAFLDICSYLSPFDWNQISGVSRNFFRIAQDEITWRANYKNYLHPFDHMQPITFAELKKQILANYLYTETNRSREDLRDYFSNVLLNFLRRHADQRWTHFYFGMLYYNGDGITSERSKGLTYLYDAFIQGDYRAYQFFSRGLTNDSPQKKMEIQRILRPGDAAKLLPFLLHAEEKKVAPLAYDIANLYRKGIGLTAPNPELSLAWNNQALNNGSSDAVETMLAGIADEKERIPLLKACYEKIPLAFVARKLGFLHKDYFTEVKDERLEHKIDIASPFKKMALKLSQKRAFMWFQLAAMQKDGSAAKQLADCYFYGEGIEKKVDEALVWYKRGFKLGNSGAAFALSLHYLTDKRWFLNPHKVWWIQSAAQCGCRKSYVALREASIRQHPFPCCAFAILQAIGIPGSFSLNLFKYKKISKPAESVLETKLDKNIIVLYKKIGEKEGLLERPIQLLIDAWQQEWEEKPILQSIPHSGKI